MSAAVDTIPARQTRPGLCRRGLSAC